MKKREKIRKFFLELPTCALLATSMVVLSMGEALAGEHGLGNILSDQEMWDGYDQDEDLRFTRADGKIMLDAIISNTEGIDETMDVNQSGKASMEDYAVLLTGARWNGYDEDFKWRYEDVIGVELQAEQTGDALEVRLSFVSPDVRQGFLDYAVLYDREKLQVEDIQWSEEFVECFNSDDQQAFLGEDMERSAITNIYEKEDRGDYVLLAGYILKKYKVPPLEKTTSFATITFSYKNDNKETGDITLVPYATEYDDSLENLKAEHTRLEPSLLGDTDGNGKITLADARTIMRLALNIETLEDESRLPYLDIGMDGGWSMEDARQMMRIALRIRKPQMRMVFANVENGK